MPEEAIWTSALATARFLEDQRPGGSAFVIGEAGLTTALHEAGYTLTERDPDYVVLGETRTYSLRADHARDPADRQRRPLHRHQPRHTGPSPDGPLPATGSVAALISRATGVDPYYVGKPNPLMMRSALNAIDAHSETTAMIGDRMDTDIVAGLEAGLEAILVLTGVTTREMAERFPFRPSRIVDSVADLVEERRSAAGQHDVVAGLAQHGHDHVAVVALQLDHAVLGRAADAAALLQPARELAQAGVVERDAAHRRHRLAAPPGHLAAHLHAPAGRRRARLRPRPAQVAVRGRVDDAAVGHQRTPTRSTTNTSVSSGPITPPAPRLP